MKKIFDFKKYKSSNSGPTCKKYGGISVCSVAYIIFALILLFSMSGCDNKNEIDDNFIDTYKNILIVRERYNNDSLLAARKVDSVMKAHNYTEPEFRDDYFRIAKDKNAAFIKAIDSLRNMIREQYDTLKSIEQELKLRNEDIEE